MQAEQSLQFIWDGIVGLDSERQVNTADRTFKQRPSPLSPGSLRITRYSVRQEIFTHVMDNRSYCTPYVSPGVYFDNPWAMPPVNASNIDEIASFLAEDMRERAGYFRTDVLLYPWGYGLPGA